MSSNTVNPYNDEATMEMLEAAGRLMGMRYGGYTVRKSVMRAAAREIDSKNANFDNIHDADSDFEEEMMQQASQKTGKETGNDILAGARGVVAFGLPDFNPTNATIASRSSFGPNGPLIYTIRIGDTLVPNVKEDDILDYVSDNEIQRFSLVCQQAAVQRSSKTAQASAEHGRQSQKKPRAREPTPRDANTTTNDANTEYVWKTYRPETRTFE